MTQRPYVSPPDQQLRDAKARLLSASRDLSPKKIIQKHPFICVGASAATSMLVTLVASSPTVKHVTGGAAKKFSAPAAGKVIDLVSKLATVYLTQLAAQSAATQAAEKMPQTSDRNAVD